MRTLLSLVLLSMILGCASRASATTCAGLDADTRRAVQSFVDDAANRSAELVDDNEELRWASRTLHAGGKRVVPCLLQLYRVGPGPTGFWSAESEPPKDGRWALKF